MQVLVGSRDKPRWSSEDSPHDTTLLLGRVLVDHESFRRVDHRRGEDADTLVLNGVEKHRVRPVDDLDGPRPLPDLHVGILISDVLAQLLVHPLVGRGDELGGAPHDAVLDGRVDPHAARIVALLARDHERLPQIITGGSSSRGSSSRRSSSRGITTQSRLGTDQLRGGGQHAGSGRRAAGGGRGRRAAGGGARRGRSRRGRRERHVARTQRRTTTLASDEPQRHIHVDQPGCGVLLPRHAQAISGRGTSPLVSQSWKGLVPCALAVSNEHLRRLRRSDG
mmetsp:Transcript_14098/g.37153  ORF Transcript_14098/g.37153 Transcript_14098/m.37153 type:complete len:280 (+) Transcript_14098:561-1400(+)